MGDIVTTTIAVSSETKERLRLLGEKGETYEQILKKLIDRSSWKDLDSRWNKILEDDEFISMDEL